MEMENIVTGLIGAAALLWLSTFDNIIGSIAASVLVVVAIVFVCLGLKSGPAIWAGIKDRMYTRRYLQALNEVNANTRLLNEQYPVLARACGTTVTRMKQFFRAAMQYRELEEPRMSFLNEAMLLQEQVSLKTLNLAQAMAILGYYEVNDLNISKVKKEMESDPRTRKIMLGVV